MFVDKDKFIDAPNSGIFDYVEEPIGQNKREIFTHNESVMRASPSFGHFFAHIP